MRALVATSFGPYYGLIVLLNRGGQMFKRKQALEEQLSAGSGRSAPAVLLSSKMGSTGWGNSPGGISDKFTITYRLRVEPAGETPFEADVKASSQDLLGAPDPQVGMTMAVLYDPEDHRRVALDIAATKTTVTEQAQALWEQDDRQENDAEAASSGDPLEAIQRLARLRDQGALTQQEFQEQKAKILGGQ